MKVIAIDGTASAGKGISSKLLAEKLNYLHIDTGAIYRAIALYLLDNNISSERASEIKNILPNIKIELQQKGTECAVFVNGTNETASGRLRTPQVSNFVPKVSKYLFIREKVRNIQHELAHNNNIVIEGRDVTTEVFPNAYIKFYLTASVEARAKRRMAEYKMKGIKIDIKDLKNNIIERDKEDMEREVSPLRQAPDAILIDNSKLTILQTVNLMYKHIKSKEKTSN